MKYTVKKGALFAMNGVVYRPGDVFECDNDKMMEGEGAVIFELPPEPEKVTKTLVEGARAGKGKGGRPAKNKGTEQPADASGEQAAADQPAAETSA